MIIELFIPLLLITVVFGLYSFAHIDLNNYTHIFSGFLSSILFILLGFESFDGIELYGSTGLLTTYNSSWLGLLLIVLGVVYVLYSLALIIDAIKNASEEISI